MINKILTRGGLQEEDGLVDARCVCDGVCLHKETLLVLRQHAREEPVDAGARSVTRRRRIHE